MALPIYSALINSPMWYVSSIMDTFEWNHDEKFGIFYYGSRTHIYFIKLLENQNTSQIILDDNKSHRNSFDTKIYYYMKAHHEYITGLCTIPNGIYMKFNGMSIIPRFASCGKDKMIRIWSFNEIENNNIDNICCCLKEFNLSTTKISGLPTCISISKFNNITCGFEKGVFLSWNYLEHEYSPQKSFYTGVTEDIVQIAWNKNRFAVSHKKGVIVIFLWNQFDSISKQTQFRAHNSDVCSVAWNPIETNLELWGDLATSGKDRRIKLWRVEKNFNLKTITMPAKVNCSSLEGSNEKDTSINTNSNWLTLHWSPVNNGTLIVTTAFGNLGVLKSPTSADIKYFSQNSFTKSHSKSIFGIVEFENRDGILLSHSLDRMLNVSRITTQGGDGEYIYSIPCLGGSVLSMDSVDHSNQLAIGCADMIRLWRQKMTPSGSVHQSNTYESTNIWNGVNGKVLSISWHPSREGVLAFGTDNGEVGCVNVARGDKKIATPSKLLHKSKVFITTWGKDIRRSVKVKWKIDTSDTSGLGDEEHDDLVVYTVGSNALLLHDFRRNEFCDVTPYLVNDLENVSDIGGSADSKKICDFVMHGSMRYFAVGYSNGVVMIFAMKTDRNPLMQVCQIRTHTKGINCMKWCPSGNRYRLAVGSNERFLTVTDFESVITKFETTVVMSSDKRQSNWGIVEFNETLAKFKGHGDRITCVDWCTMDMNKLASSSYDHTVFIWSITDNAAVVSFTCHQGRVLCCKWSNRDPDLIYSGGEDSNLFVWRPSEQRLHRDLNKRRNLAPFLPGVNVQGHKASEIVEEIDQSTTVVGNGDEKEKKNDEEEKMRNNLDKKKRIKTDVELDFGNQKKAAQKFIKKRNSLFPTTIFNVHHGLETYQNGVLNFVENKIDYLPCLSLLDSRAAILKQISVELENLKKDGNLENYFLLLIWVGKIGQVVRESISMKYCPDWLMMIIFAYTSHDIPKDLIDMIVSNILTNKNDPVLAATYCLALSDSEHAVNVLLKNECFREALVMAKLRLPPNHGLIGELLIKLKDHFFKIGSFELCALCYLELHNYQGFIDSMNRRTSKLANWVTIKTLIIHCQFQLADQCAFNFVNALILESAEDDENSADCDWWKQWVDRIENTSEISFYFVLLKVHELIWRDRKNLVEIWNLIRNICRKYEKTNLSILRQKIQSKLVTKQLNQSRSQISSYLTYEISIFIIDYADFDKIDIIDDLSNFHSINDLINQYQSITLKGSDLINQLIGIGSTGFTENIVKSIIDNLMILKLQD